MQVLNGTTPDAVFPPGGWTRPVDVRVLRLGEADAGAWARLLDAAEHRRAARFRFEADRDRFILGRGLLRLMLGGALGRRPESLAFGANPAGKPTLEEAGTWAFNVAHSGRFVMVGLAEARAIGVDIEQHRPDIDPVSLSARVFAPGERRLVETAPEDRRTAVFFRLWVSKEALLKGLGTGFSSDSTFYEMTDGGASGARAWRVGATREPLPGWEFHEIAIADGYSAAIALLP